MCHYFCRNFDGIKFILIRTKNEINKSALHSKDVSQQMKQQSGKMFLLFPRIKWMTPYQHSFKRFQEQFTFDRENSDLDRIQKKRNRIIIIHVCTVGSDFTKTWNLEAPLTVTLSWNVSTWKGYYGKEVWVPISSEKINSNPVFRVIKHHIYIVSLKELKNLYFVRF